ncbi:MAG: ATPase, T2SS/T4P/T4SS family, partial [Arenicellales bacterium]
MLGSGLSKPVDTPRKHIGDILVARGLLEDYQLQYALLEQSTTQAPLGDILENCGFVSQYDVAKAVAEQWGMEFVDVARVKPDEDALRLFRRNFCMQHQFLPCKVAGDAVHVIASRGDVDQLTDLVSRRSGMRAVLYVGEKNKLSWAIQYYYFFLENPVEAQLKRQIAEASSETHPSLSLEPLVTNLFRLAVKNRATDIHMRPTGTCIIVSFRVDGLLMPVFALKPNMRRIISTLKIRAQMDIAEQRLPQDGAFSINILDTDYDIRASTTVSPDGENLVLRILPRNSNTAGFEELGFLKEDIPMLNRMFMHPHGVILLTGPTGSGKTTTLYAGVRGQDLLRRNVITVENPIEYKVPLIRQTEVNTKAGYTFASAIRYFLRHDPDIILVGEIRDSETAQTALAAAETGHLVLSTLHTNNVFGTIPRLNSMGITDFMIADSLIGVVSQRLVRQLCESCKESYAATEEERQYLRDASISQLYRSRGCRHCAGTGYYGRTPIYEILR